MGQLMVKSQEWLTSKNGFKMVSPMNFMVFKPQDLNPGQSSIFVMSRTTQKTTWVDFQIWSDHRCFFPWHVWHPDFFFLSPWGPPPADAISDDPLGLHPSRTVVQIRKGGLSRAAAAAATAAAWDGPRCNCEIHGLVRKVYKVYMSLYSSKWKQFTKMLNHQIRWFKPWRMEMGPRWVVPNWTNQVRGSEESSQHLDVENPTATDV